MANWSSDLDWWSFIFLSHHCRCFHMVILSNSCFSCCSVPGCYVAASSRMVTPLHIAPQENLRSIGSQFLLSMCNTWLISNVNPHPVLNPRFVVNHEFIVNPQFVVNGEFIIIPQFFVNPQFDVNGEFIVKPGFVLNSQFIANPQFINLSSTNVLLQTAVCLGIDDELGIDDDS